MLIFIEKKMLIKVDQSKLHYSKKYNFYIVS